MRPDSPRGTHVQDQRGDWYLVRARSTTDLEFGMSAMGASCSMVGFSDSECAGRRCLAERRCPRSARLLRYGHSASVLRALMLPAKDVVFAEHNDSDSAIAVIWTHHIMARVVPTAVALEDRLPLSKTGRSQMVRRTHSVSNDQAVRAVKDDFDGREIVSVQFPTAGADNWATRDATYCGTTGWNSGVRHPQCVD